MGHVQWGEPYSLQKFKIWEYIDVKLTSTKNEPNKYWANKKKCFMSWVPCAEQELRKYWITGESKGVMVKGYVTNYTSLESVMMRLPIFLHKVLEGFLEKVRFQSKQRCTKISCLIKVLELLSTTITLGPFPSRLIQIYQVTHKTWSTELLPIFKIFWSNLTFI